MEFRELTLKQREFLKRFLILNFAKELVSIQYSLDFVEGGKNEISFGAITIKRTGNLQIVIFSKVEYFAGLCAGPQTMIVTSNLKLLLSLPDQ